MTRGPGRGAASEDLNATKLVWPAGEQLAEHAADGDVVYVVRRLWSRGPYRQEPPNG